MVCHSLVHWTTFCQTSPPWPVCLGWPHTSWLSFIELDKAVVHVIRLASFLWLWFQSAYPLMPSLSTYYLTWVFLSLDVGYLFTPLQQSTATAPDLGQGVSPLGLSCVMQPPLLWFIHSISPKITWHIFGTNEYLWNGVNFLNMPVSNITVLSHLHSALYL